MNSYLCRRTVLRIALGLAASVGFSAASHAADAPAVASTGGGAAAEWMQWRGPKFNGSSDAKNLPETFSKTENVLWTTALPGVSNGTPVVAGDKVFLSSLDQSSKKLLAICVNRADGKILWQKDVGIGFVARGENNMATPSPVTDGKHVWFLYGTGDFAAFDVAGNPVWTRNLQKEIGSFNIMWIYGSSPLLHEGKLYVQVLHKGTPYDTTALPGAKKVDGAAPSYLLAVDPATGKDLWRHDRPDDAVGETKESYGTPIPFTTANGRREILITGGDAVTGHDPDTGRELWRFTGWNPSKIGHWRLVPSAVTGGGVILGCAPKGGPVMAVKQDGNGTIPFDGAAWVSKSMTSDVCVPLFYKDRFYVLDPNGKKLHQADPATGEVKWTTELGGGAVFRASPTGADGKVYCMNVNGDVWVVSADDGKILHNTALEGAKWSRGSPVAVDGMLLIRAGETLYAFGKK